MKICYYLKVFSQSMAPEILYEVPNGILYTTALNKVCAKLYPNKLTIGIIGV